MQSNISLSLGYYNGSWHYTDPQNLTGLNTYTISGVSTNLTLNFTLLAGNLTSRFYTPLLQNGITLDVWNLAPPVGADVNYSVALPLNLIRFSNCSPDYENPDSRPVGQTSTIAAINATNNGSASGSFTINLTGTLNTGWTIWASNDSLSNNLTLSTTAQTIWSDVAIDETKKIWLAANCSKVSANPGQSITMWAV